MADSQDSIRWRRMALNRAQGDKMRELMTEYNETVFRPALAALVEECAAAGHGPLTIKWNGLGWNWEECEWCGGRARTWRDGEEPE